MIKKEALGRKFCQLMFVIALLELLSAQPTHSSDLQQAISPLAIPAVGAATSDEPEVHHNFIYLPHIEKCEDNKPTNEAIEIEIIARSRLLQLGIPVDKVTADFSCLDAEEKEVARKTYQMALYTLQQSIPKAAQIYNVSNETIMAGVLNTIGHLNLDAQHSVIFAGYPPTLPYSGYKAPDQSVATLGIGYAPEFPLESAVGGILTVMDLQLATNTTPSLTKFEQMVLQLFLGRGLYHDLLHGEQAWRLDAVPGAFRIESTTKQNPYIFGPSPVGDAGHSYWILRYFDSLSLEAQNTPQYYSWQLLVQGVSGSAFSTFNSDGPGSIPESQLVAEVAAYLAHKKNQQALPETRISRLMGRLFAHTSETPRMDEGQPFAAYTLDTHAVTVNINGIGERTGYFINPTAAIAHFQDGQFVPRVTNTAGFVKFLTGTDAAGKTIEAVPERVHTLNLSTGRQVIFVEENAFVYTTDRSAHSLAIGDSLLLSTEMFGAGKKYTEAAHLYISWLQSTVQTAALKTQSATPVEKAE